MTFPADIKGCMKDCILSLFWPRKDIVGFFEKHGCSKAELSGLQIDFLHAHAEIGDDLQVGEAVHQAGGSSVRTRGDDGPDGRVGVAVDLKFLSQQFG